MPMERVRRGEAIPKTEFHARLRKWLKNTDEVRIGPDDVPGVTPWIYVRERNIYEFHADVKRDAAERYLLLVDRFGDDLEWTIVANERGNENAVAYGPEHERLIPFYL